MRNRLTVNLVIALSSTLILVGCGQSGRKPSRTSTMTSGHAVINTSDAIYTLAWKLSDAFRAQYPDAWVDIARMDNRSMMDSLLSERVEEVFLDRAVLPEESLAFRQAKLKLLTYGIAYYPVYIANRRDNPVKAFDSLGLRKALTGQITNWKALDGDDRPLTVYLPLPGEGAWESLMAYYGRLDSVSARICTTAAQMIELAADDPGALLVYSLPITEDMPYKWLYFDGEELAAANVKQILEKPIYPFMLRITYVTTHDKDDVAAGFLTFCMGNLGQRTAMEMGYRPAAVPVKIVQRKKPAES